MGLDGLFLHHLQKELSENLVGGRLNKIYQVGKQEFLLLFYNNKKYKLYISLAGDRSRVNITNKDFHYPETAPMWAMILRKHLSNALLIDIIQHGYDRVLTFKFAFTNAIGDTSIKYLTLELMGRHSNMILHDDDKIIDCVKHVNAHRFIYPQVKYELPESNKIAPLDVDSNLSVEEIIAKYQGVSKYSAAMIKENISLFELKPTLFTSGFYFNEVPNIEVESNDFNSLSQLLDEYFYQKDVKDRIKQTTENLRKFIKQELTKNKKKLKNLNKDLNNARNSEKYRLEGDILYANLHLLKKGHKEVTLNDFEGNEVLISLNPLLSPSDNAKKKFVKYTKARNGLKLIDEQIAITNDEIAYLDSVETLLNNCQLKDAIEIKEELTSLGYFRNRNKKKSKKKHIPAFERFTSPEGVEILVGKNNIQNEYITFKEAKKDDIWMHAKDIPGSHVIIRMSEPSEPTIRYAANIAALYSKASTSSSVPVDYTLVRNVKKVPGKKPGFVIISNQRTIYIDPDKNLM